MNWVISGTWGPTDPTRAMLPFVFAASAVQAGDTVTLMLFHDAVLMAVEGVGKTLVPFGPPNRYEEIASNPNVTLWACKPCVEVRGRAARRSIAASSSAA
jgi:tRNA 2-thiouridine synthesizing protein D